MSRNFNENADDFEDACSTDKHVSLPHTVWISVYPYTSPLAIDKQVSRARCKPSLGYMDYPVFLRDLCLNALSRDVFTISLYPSQTRTLPVLLMERHDLLLPGLCPELILIPDAQQLLCKVNISKLQINQLTTPQICLDHCKYKPIFS